MKDGVFVTSGYSNAGRNGWWVGVAIAASVALLSGCTGAFEGKKIDYKSAGKLPPLEVPPDLTSPGAGTRYTVPDAKPDNTFSKYEQGRTAPAAGAGPTEGVAPTERVRVERGGIQRWLVVRATPQQVWPLVKDFWQENGFLIAVEEQRNGWMETDWSENRAKIPVGGLTGFLNRALDAVSSLPERDKFRARLEPGAEPGTTEVYLSHKGMAEVYYRERDNNTRWQLRPSDTELEALMLSRLATRLGLDEVQTKAAVRAADASQPRASLASSGDATIVALTDPFDRAWRRVGLALDRVGFMVEDRNRADGVYFVKYQDPEAEAPKRSGVSKLAFWRSDEVVGPGQYRIKVAARAEGGTEVSVLSKDGVVEQTDTAKRILAVLVEQLR
jgi:outer membrane protein assembly factor BamC